jgi:hypothetical protein
MQRRVVTLKLTDVSEVRTAYIIRVRRYIPKEFELKNSEELNAQHMLITALP